MMMMMCICVVCQFSPILMVHAPHYTVNAWMKAHSFLNPRNLLPALMRYDPNAPVEGNSEVRKRSDRETIRDRDHQRQRDHELLLFSLHFILCPSFTPSPLIYVRILSFCILSLCACHCRIRQFATWNSVCSAWGTLTPPSTTT